MRKTDGEIESVRNTPTHTHKERGRESEREREKERERGTLNESSYRLPAL